MGRKNGKPCKKCGTSEWDKWGTCKKCKRKQTREWQKNNPDKIAERNKRYRQTHPEVAAEADRRWKQANPDKLAEYQRRWNQNHPGIRQEFVRRWQMANPDKVNAITHRRRTRKTEAGGSYTAAEWQALCRHYGNKCLKCGRGDVKLTADHIKPVSKGGTSNIDNIQPLCFSCNAAKHDRHIDYRPDAGPMRWLQCKLFG